MSLAASSTARRNMRRIPALSSTINIFIMIPIAAETLPAGQ
jgi:hypothetical protein